MARPISIQAECKVAMASGSETKDHGSDVDWLLRRIESEDDKATTEVYITSMEKRP